MPPGQAKYQLSKTYSKTKRKRKVRKDRPSIVPTQNAQPHINDSIFNADHSLRDGYWMDEFDLLAQGKTPLRKRNLLKRDVRADYNRDSSIEGSPLPLSPLLLSQLETSPPIPDSPFKLPTRPPVKHSKHVSKSVISKHNSQVDTEDFTCLAKEKSSKPREKDVACVTRNTLTSILDKIYTNVLSPVNNVKHKDTEDSQNQINKAKEGILERGKYGGSIIRPIFFKDGPAELHGSLDSSNRTNSRSEETTNIPNENVSQVSTIRSYSYDNPIQEVFHADEIVSDTRNLLNRKTIRNSNLTRSIEQSETNTESLQPSDQLLENGNASFSGNIRSSKVGSVIEGEGTFDYRVSDSVERQGAAETSIECHGEETACIQNIIHSSTNLSSDALSGEDVRHSEENSSEGTSDRNVSAKENVAQRLRGKLNEKTVDNLKLHKARNKSEVEGSNVVDKINTNYCGEKMPGVKSKQFTLAENSTRRITRQAKKNIQIDSIGNTGKNKNSRTQKISKNIPEDLKARPLGRKGKFSKTTADVSLPSRITARSIQRIPRIMERSSHPVTYESKHSDLQEQNINEAKNNLEQPVKLYRTNQLQNSVENKSKQSNSQANKEIVSDRKALGSDTHSRYFLRSKRNSRQSASKSQRSIYSNKAEKSSKQTTHVAVEQNAEHEEDQQTRNSNQTAVQTLVNERLSHAVPPPVTLRKSNSSNQCNSNFLVNTLKTPQGRPKNLKVIISTLPSTPVWKKLRRVKIKLKRVHVLSKLGESNALRSNVNRNAPKMSAMDCLNLTNPNHQQTEPIAVPEDSTQEVRLLSSRLSANIVDDVNLSIHSVSNADSVETHSTFETNEDSVGKNLSSENEDVSDDDSSVDSLLDMNTYSQLLNQSSNLNNKTVLSPHFNVIARQNVGVIQPNGYCKEDNVIKKRKSRLSMNKSPEKTANEMTELRKNVDNRPLNNCKVRLKRLKILRREEKARNFVNMSRVVDDSQKCENKKTVSATLQASTSEENSRINNGYELSCNIEHNKLNDRTTEGSNTAVSSRSDDILEATASASKSDRNSYDNSSLTTRNQSSIIPLQRSLDDSIDRDDFINAITRNATQFMNKSNIPMASISEKLVDRNIMNVDSYRNDSETESPRVIVPISRRSSILAGTMVPSLISTLCEMAESHIDGDNSLLTDGSLILRSGKWRKALSVWKKTFSMVTDKTFGTLSANTSANNTNNHSTSISRRDQQLRYRRNSPTTHTSYMLLSSHGSVVRKDNASISNVESEILKEKSLRHSNAKSKNPAFVLPRPEPILEHSQSEWSPTKPKNSVDNRNVHFY